MPSVTVAVPEDESVPMRRPRPDTLMKARRLSTAQLNVRQNGCCPKCLVQCTEGMGVYAMFLVRLIVVCAYIGVGVLFYCQMEGWSKLQAVYFSMVTMSTVGYGDLTPSSAGSRAFTVLYTLVGIVLIFTQVSALMTIITQPCYDALTRWIERRFPNEGFDIDGNGQADYHVPPSAFVFYTSRLAGPLIALTIVQLVGAACFHAVEGWHFSTALYHCFITATTCGYGDVGIQTDSGMVLAFWHITTSVCVLGSFIGEFDSTRTERQAQLKRQALMLAKMEANVWQGIIQPGQETVDKFGFVYGMLVQLDLVQQSDVEVFVKMFERSDKAKTGRLQRSDMSDIARGYANRASKIEAYKRQSSVALRMSRGSVRCSKAPSRATAMGSTTSSTAFSNADPKQVQVKVMGALTQQSSVISIPENE